MSVTVRYFAAAAEAAGVASETLDDAAARTAGELRATMVAAHGPELGRVLGRCSLLAAGSRLVDDASPVPPGVTVDVLPPFAGG
ncbi:MoaD/ThiS family protein [uncultured Cellulomonas sp.]|uniref:MoaD/ThiS family protein n=1 Tax=uncultured Cellulomonas sp. TaxID=189682 RepID=UPI00261CA053|nr:MoaD/ThiS family protein [uncultured Cellulomonas sp.]